MNKRIFYSSIFLLLLFMAEICFAWSSAFLPNTHKAIGQGAINILTFMSPADYPDITMFSNSLLDGCSSEAGHPGQIYNGGDVRDWWKNEVTTSYECSDYPGAYFHLGEICHLTQDQAVPTHAANIRHGLAQWPPSNMHIDDLEFHASYNYLAYASVFDAYPMPYSYYQPLQDDTRSKLDGWVKPSTGQHYWVPVPDPPSTGQDATAPGQPWGHYGGSNDADIYHGSPPESPEITTNQLSQAVAYTAGILEAVSKKLPPLVKDLTIEPSAQAIPVINKQTGNQISFKILENRKKTVKVFITVDATYGDPIISADYGTGKAFDLSAGTNLPWEGTYSVTWNGILANGLYPAEGVHSLYGKKSA